MVGHDLEEFRAVVRRHGDWSADITLFNEAQSDLFAGHPETTGPVAVSHAWGADT